MHTKTINRRYLFQQLAVLAAGASLLPKMSFAAAANNGQPGVIYIAPGEGKAGKVGDMSILFKLNKAQTSQHLGLWESTIKPGELGAPPHYHNGYDEICRVLEGTVFILTGNRVTEVKAGGWHLRPRGVVHTFWNSGTIPAKTIDMCIPGGHEDYMQDLAALFENNSRPKPAEMAGLAAKHDIHFAWDQLPGIMEQYKVHL